MAKSKLSSWSDFSIYLPFYIAAVRWGMFLILRVIPSLFYRDISHDIKKTAEGIERDEYRTVSKVDVTVVVTVYQPPEGFMPAMRQVRKNGACRVLIIADVTCYKDVQAMLDLEGFDCAVFTVVCEHKAGKRAALATGIAMSTTLLTLLMDDDAVWVDTFLETAILPFQYKNIGGVGVKQTAHLKTWWNLTDVLADMRLAVRYLELRATTTVDKGCSCISGRTGVYLTSLVNTPEFMYEFLNEKFFGMITLSGDDKFLTRWVINHGYKTYHQLYNRTKLTTTFESGGKLLRQLIRWSRNTWRSDLKNLFFERKIWRSTPFTAFCMLDKFYTPLFLLFGPIFVITLFFLHGMDWVHLVGYGIWLMVSRGIRICYHLVEHPFHIVYLPFFILFQYTQAVIRIYALLTISNFHWGTRDVGVGKDGKVARTGEMVDEGEDDGSVQGLLLACPGSSETVNVDPFSGDTGSRVSAAHSKIVVVSKQ